MLALEFCCFFVRLFPSSGKRECPGIFECNRIKPKTHAAFRDNRQSHSQKRELCFFIVMSAVCLRFNQQEELSLVLFTLLTLLLGTDITAHFVCGSYLTCKITMHYIISVWNGKFFILKQILAKLLESKHVFPWQTTDKEAPGLVRMHTMAYLSGFPGSLKETEQLRVKLPAVVTSKIKQVKLLSTMQCSKWPQGGAQDCKNH